MGGHRTAYSTAHTITCTRCACAAQAADVALQLRVIQCPLLHHLKSLPAIETTSNRGKDYDFTFLVDHWEYMGFARKAPSSNSQRVFAVAPQDRHIWSYFSCFCMQDLVRGCTYFLQRDLLHSQTYNHGEGHGMAPYRNTSTPLHKSIFYVPLAWRRQLTRFEHISLPYVPVVC